MGEWKPLFIGLFIIIVIGAFMPVIIAPFIDLSDIQDTGIFTPLINLMNNGVTVDLFGSTYLATTFDFFGFTGDTVRQSITDYLTVFSIIPLYITIPLFVFSIVGITYTILKTLPTT